MSRWNRSSSLGCIIYIYEPQLVDALRLYNKKSNRRLYALRKLKVCGVQERELVAVDCSLLKSILEYASVVFEKPTAVSLHDGVLRIIFGPDLSYEDALERAGLLGSLSNHDDDYNKKPTNLHI